MCLKSLGIILILDYIIQIYLFIDFFANIIWIRYIYFVYLLYMLFKYNFLNYLFWEIWQNKYLGKMRYLEIYI